MCLYCFQDLIRTRKPTQLNYSRNHCRSQVRDGLTRTELYDCQILPSLALKCYV